MDWAKRHAAQTAYKKAMWKFQCVCTDQRQPENSVAWVLVLVVLVVLACENVHAQ